MHTQFYKPSLRPTDSKAPWIPFIQRLFSKSLLGAKLCASLGEYSAEVHKTNLGLSGTFHSRPNILAIENLWPGAFSPVVCTWLSSWFEMKI